MYVFVLSRMVFSVSRSRHLCLKARLQNPLRVLDRGSVCTRVSLEKMRRVRERVKPSWYIVHLVVLFGIAVSFIISIFFFRGVSERFFILEVLLLCTACHYAQWKAQFPRS